ncbi:A24 family peptidase [Oryzifoliimicrobium ureilyticus]|uniref:A24 family peptidase n=1 Tax=Oryzifoliimicrobium ureilyticus TaxID=3113724 RepID=UPI0030761CEC
MPNIISSALLTVFPLCLAFAAISDFLTLTIPNRISIILILGFVLLAPLTGMAWPLFGLHLAAGVCVLIVCFACFALNIMGGGDAKLLAASAVWFGFGEPLIQFLAYTAAMGGVLAIVILVARSQQSLLAAAGVRLPQSFLTTRKIPYGIAIAAGGFLAFPSTPLFDNAMSLM